MAEISHSHVSRVWDLRFKVSVHCCLTAGRRGVRCALRGAVW